MTKTSTVARRAMLALCAGIFACADGGTEPRLPAAASIEIDLSGDSIAFGDVANATATVYNDDGQEIPAGSSVSWSSSDSDVLQVDGEGRITAMGVGSATVTAEAGDVSASVELTVTPRALNVTTPDASVGLYETLIVELGPDAPQTSVAPVVGVFGTDTLWFSATDSLELSAVVVGVPAASGALVIHVDRNHTAALTVSFEPAPAVADVEAELDAVQRVIDTRLAELDSLGVVAGGALVGTDFVRAIADDFRTWSDTADAEARLAVAQFHAAQAARAGLALRVYPASVAAADEGCVGSFSARGLERRFAQCVVMVGLGIGAIGLGLDALPTCNAPATPVTMGICLAGLAATIGGAVVAYNSADVARDLPGMILDQRIEAVARWFEDVSTGASMAGSASRSSSVADLELVSGARYALDTRATYRSVAESDHADAGPAGTLVDLLDTFHEGWTSFTAFVGRLPGIIRSGLPALAESPGSAPAEAAAVVEEEVPAEYLSVASPTAGTAVQFDPADRSFTVTLEQGLESDFEFDLVYASPVDQFTMRVAGSARVDAEIDVDGGQNQSGEAGVELAQPLVVRVTDAVTGVGIAGVPVGWVVLAGGGSLSADSSLTDAQGRASVRWTLGDSEDEQVVHASAAYGDGQALAGGPASFTALTAWPYTLQVMRYEPTYENMTVVGTLSRGDAFTTPNGLSRHFRLLRDGVPVGDTALAGVEVHYFADEAYPLDGAADGHIPDYVVMAYDAVNRRDIMFPLDVTLSSAGYRAVAGRTVRIYNVASPYPVRELTLNADGTTRLVLDGDPTTATTGRWNMSEGTSTWWNSCSGTIVSKPAAGYAYVPGTTPTNYIVIFTDGTLGFNSVYSCPNVPDSMRWIVE